MRNTGNQRRAVAAVFTTLSVLIGIAAADAQSPWDWDHYLRPEWDTVTPGAVSGPPAAVRLGSDRWGLAIKTEDRHLRVYDVAGNPVGSVRTGVRSASAIVSEPGGTLLLVGDGTRIVRVHPAGGRATVIRTLTVPAQDLWSDPAGNVYVTDGAHRIHHISAAGTPLWSRSVPDGIGATASTDDGLFLGSRSGELLRFDQQGSGSVIFRSEGGITDVMVRSGARRDYLVTRDDRGVLSGLEYIPTGSGAGARRLWRIDVARQELLGIDGGERLWVIAPGGVITGIDNEGTARPAMRIEGIDRSRAAVAAYPGRVYAIDRDLRIRTVSAEGHVESAVQLRGTPESIVFVPQVDQLVTLYADWTLQVYSSRTADPASAGPGRNTGQRPAVPTAAATPGALRAFADTVLAGTSLLERERLVATLEERINRGSLYGAVADYRSVAIDLLQEEGNSAGIRRAAVGLLESLLDRPSREALKSAAITDPDLSVASAAVSALAKFGVIEDPFLQRIHQRYLRIAAGVTTPGSARDQARYAGAMVEALAAYPAVPGSEAFQRRQRIVVEVAATLGSSPEVEKIRRRLIEMAHER